MSKISNLKIKYYSNLKRKYPNSEYVYRIYKINNMNFHNSNKLKSWMFLNRLIRAEKGKKDLSQIKSPKNTFNPLLQNSCASKFSFVQSDNCYAIPDSQLLARKSPEALVGELERFDVISFDIFDTCVFRPYCQPIDMFYLLECKFNCFNFFEYRLEAERKARAKTKKPNYEVDIYDIYEELAKLCHVKKEDAEVEMQTEIEVCYANEYMLKVFNLLKKKKKKLVATSDMYLPAKTIKAILDKNGFVGFDKIFVSNEYGYNKASGKLFEVVKQNYPAGTKFAHVGDNREADVAGGMKAGFSTFHFQQCNEFGNQYRPASLVSPVSSVYKGVVNNYMYGSSHKNTAREDFGFIYAGPIVAGFCEWLNEFTSNNNLDSILFLARDMDIVYKMYNKHYKEHNNEYAVASRFALQEVITNDYPGEFFHHTIKARCNRGYTIKQAFNEINLDFLCKECPKYGLDERDFIIGEKIGKLEELFDDNRQKIADHFANHEKAAKQYFKSKIGKARKICVVDLGWRGSILAYLKYLLVDKWKLCDEVKGVLFGSTINTTSINLISKGIVTSYAYNHIHNRDLLRNKDWETEYINLLILESIFTSKEASLLEYTLKNNKVELVYAEKNPNAPIIQEFQTGIERFIDEFERYRKPYRKYYPLSAVDAYEAMFNIAGNYDYASRIIGDVVDTPFAIAGLNIKDNKFVPLGELMCERGLIKQWPLK